MMHSPTQKLGASMTNMAMKASLNTKAGAGEVGMIPLTYSHASLVAEGTMVVDNVGVQVWKCACMYH